MVSYPATYEDSVGLCETVIARGRDGSGAYPSIQWRVPIRGVVFAGPLESLQATVVPDKRFAPSVVASPGESPSWTYSDAVLRRVDDRYEAVGAAGQEAGAVVLDDDDDDNPVPPSDGWLPIPTRRSAVGTPPQSFELHEGTLAFAIAVDVLGGDSPRAAELDYSRTNQPSGRPRGVGAEVRLRPVRGRRRRHPRRHPRCTRCGGGVDGRLD